MQTITVYSCQRYEISTKPFEVSSHHPSQLENSVPTSRFLWDAKVELPLSATRFSTRKQRTSLEVPLGCESGVTAVRHPRRFSSFVAFVYIER